MDINILRTTFDAAIHSLVSEQGRRLRGSSWKLTFVDGELYATSVLPYDQLEKEVLTAKMVSKSAARPVRKALGDNIDVCVICGIFTTIPRGTDMIDEDINVQTLLVAVEVA